MDHFESIVATFLEAEGYWVKRSFKETFAKEKLNFSPSRSLLNFFSVCVWFLQRFHQEC